MGSLSSSFIPAGRLRNPPFPSRFIVSDRPSPSRVRLAASRPGLLRADPRGDAVHEGKGGVRAVWTGRKEPFGHTGRLEPQPRGAVTRRAVAQRRSRVSGLTRLLAEAIREASHLLVFVSELNAGMKESIHLVVQPSVCFAVAAVDAEGPHELRERVSQANLAALGPYRFGREPSHQQTGQGAVGQLVLACPTQDQPVRAVLSLVLMPVAGGWCGAGCTTPSAAP